MPRHVHAKHCWLQKEFGTASVRRVSMKIVAAVKGINSTLVPSHFAFLYIHVGGNCKLSMLIFWYMTFQSRQLFTAFRITQLWTSPMWRDMSRQWQSLRANYWLSWWWYTCGAASIIAITDICIWSSFQKNLFWTQADISCYSELLLKFQAVG